MAGLAPNDPFKSPDCAKDNCPIPQGHCKGKCSKENIIYTATCDLCEQQQILEQTSPDNIIHRQYLGETSRTLRVRAAQHMNDLVRCTKNKHLEEGTSWMWDHHVAQHGAHIPPDPKNFSFKVLETFKDPMTRQIKEASRIQMALEKGLHLDSKGDKISVVSLNRKNEYFQAKKRNNHESD